MIIASLRRILLSTAAVGTIVALTGVNSVSSALADTIVLEGIVITTSKVEEKAIDSPSGATAVSRETLDDQFQPDELESVLNTIPGVETQTTPQDPAMAIRIRGLQDFGRVNVLVEGARQNFQRSGHSADGAFYLEPEMIGGINVTRGPSSTVYGSGAIGGVVAFELLDADDILRDGETAAVRLRGRHGSNGNRNLGSITGAARVGNFDVLAQANRRDHDEYSDGDGNIISGSGQETDSFLGKARWRPVEGHEISVSAIKYEAEFTDAASQSTTASQRESVVENNQYTLGYSFSRPDVPLLDFNARIYRNTTELEQTLTKKNAFNPDPLDSVRLFDVVTDGIDVSNTSRIDFGAAKLAVTYGGDVFWDEVATQDPDGAADFFTPKGERKVWGVVTQAQLTLFDKLDLIGAVRYDDYLLEDETNELAGNRVSPKATVAWEIFPGIKPFATYSEGYRSPAITETLITGVHPGGFAFVFQPNPDLNPEVATNIEAGVNLSFDGVLVTKDHLRAKVVVFRNKVEDYIGLESSFFQFSNIAKCGSFIGCAQYVNLQNVTIRGVEFETAYDAQDWFVSLSGQHIRGEDDATGNALVSVGPDNLIMTLGFRLGDKVIGGVRGNFYREQDETEQAAIHSDGYSTWDLFVRYEMHEYATINFNIDNVFDRDYRRYLNAADSPGMNARIGLTARFGG